MLKSTNKIKVSSLLTMILFASWIFISCGKEKKTEESGTTMPTDSTEQMSAPKMAPDSLPVVDSAATTRPEGRNT